MSYCCRFGNFCIIVLWIKECTLHIPPFSTCFLHFALKHWQVNVRQQKISTLRQTKPFVKYPPVFQVFFPPHLTTIIFHGVCHHFYNETKSPLYHSCKLNSKFIQILLRFQDNFDESSKIIMNAKRFWAKCFGGKIVLVHLECNYVSQS